jgi:hypothetical protein
MFPPGGTADKRSVDGAQLPLTGRDSQAADASSLDSLAYLIAGFRGQNLALVVTMREEDRPVGHPLNGALERSCHRAFSGHTSQVCRDGGLVERTVSLTDPRAPGRAHRGAGATSSIAPVSP